MQAVKAIQNIYPGFTPKVGIVLGSGLGGLADAITEQKVIAYSDIPGFPEINIAGHSGNLILGKLNNVPVAALQGRSHSYEHLDYEPVKTYVRSLKLLGCEYYIATNAAGSMLEAAGPGSLVLVNDHINMHPGNPLVGQNDDEFGPRFLAMDGAYNPELRQKLKQQAEKLSITLHEGVYMAVLGPMYETAAEIRAYKTMGADLIGMSTVPEVIVAHHCGLKVAVVSMVTNFATGISKTPHDHAQVIAVAAKAGKNLELLISAVIGDLA